MELAPLFAEQRWNILKHLSNEALSPLQLAGLTKTTIANISQQLRLLEAADLVKKEKIPNRDRGQPRSLFSLTKDYAYVVSVMDRFAEKKLIRLTPNQKSLMKIWSIDDTQQREQIEKAYFEAHGYLDRARATAVDLSSKPVLVIVTSDRASIKALEGMDGVRLLDEGKIRDYLKKSDTSKFMAIDDPYQLFSTGAGKEGRRKTAA